MRLSLSLVSHGHGSAVATLLTQLAALDEPRPARVLLTLNRPEAALADRVRATSWPFELQLIENPVPLGFGCNHNSAFAQDQCSEAPADAFAVVNPDICLLDNPFVPLLAALRAMPQAGCVYPMQLGVDGAPQDHERLLPTPVRLLRRTMARVLGQSALEVPHGQPPDWVNAAFLLLRAEAFAVIGGFDEAYHMYGEDVDLCLRLQLAGWGLKAVPGARVEHVAQRASHRRPRHLAWHLRSLWRLWRSPAYRDFRRHQSPGPMLL